jgi:erythronate-4-phosphate dehydrogenase
MKVIIDDKIPYIKGALEPFAEVLYLPGKDTTPAVVKEADALITRTRTICNESLLKGSKVSFIATATIGFDHIDTVYCEQSGITWTNAPGCNAKSVEQYIASVLFVMAERKGWTLAGKTLGVVGVGQVGSKVARLASILGMKVLLNDPPRARVEGETGFCSLETVLAEADIITLHVPLNLQGEDATYHMADEAFFKRLGKKPMLINACRGEVMETKAAIEAVRQERLTGLVVDCWEFEPNPDPTLLSLVDLATPHIAGYSKDGKANGTSMSVQALSRFFNLGIDDWTATGVEVPEQTTLSLVGSSTDGTLLNNQELLAQAILSTYDIRKDDNDFRHEPHRFEALRGDYPLRREFPVYTIEATKLPAAVIEQLKQLGFTVLLKD